jgi:hypothetical protein
MARRLSAMVTMNDEHSFGTRSMKARIVSFRSIALIAAAGLTLFLAGEARAQTPFQGVYATGPGLSPLGISQACEVWPATQIGPVKWSGNCRLWTNGMFVDGFYILSFSGQYDGVCTFQFNGNPQIGYFNMAYGVIDIGGARWIRQ